MSSIPPTTRTKPTRMRNPKTAHLPMTLSGSQANEGHGRDKSGECRWKLAAENGEIVADSGGGYKLKGYTRRKARELFPDAKLVVEDETEG